MMEKVDIVIENGTILTMDSQENRIENGFLSITGDHISQEELVPKHIINQAREILS